MLSKEENELLTRVHSDNPMGRLFRQYWIPAHACATESMGGSWTEPKSTLGVSDSYVIQVRKFLLKALRDFQTCKPPPGLVYDSSQADFSRIRCDVAYLSSKLSWRALFGL
jgi:hypothetical protein